MSAQHTPSSEEGLPYCKAARLHFGRMLACEAATTFTWYARYKIRKHLSSSRPKKFSLFKKKREARATLRASLPQLRYCDVREYSSLLFLLPPGRCSTFSSSAPHHFRAQRFHFLTLPASSVLFFSVFLTNVFRVFYATLVPPCPLLIFLYFARLFVPHLLGSHIFHRLCFTSSQRICPFKHFYSAVRAGFCVALLIQGEQPQ